MLLLNSRYSVRREADITSVTYTNTKQLPPPSDFTLSGPSQVQAGVLSAYFAVVLDVPASQSVQINLALSGEGVFDPSATLTFTAGQQVAFFRVEIAFTGFYTITANTALGERKLVVESIADPVTLVDLSTNWRNDVNPAREFRSSQGTIPAGDGGYPGAANKVRAHAEWARIGFAAKSVQLNCDQASDLLTTTDFRPPGFVTPEYPALVRVADPEAVDKWAYLHNVRRDEFGTDWKHRSEVMPVGTTQRTSFGCEEWAAFGVWLPSSWLDLHELGSEFSILWQWHGSPGSVATNPPIVCKFKGGAGIASQAHFELDVKIFSGIYTLETLRKSVQHTSRVVRQINFSPAMETWHWFVVHMVTGPGPGGGNGYLGDLCPLPVGYSDPSQVFVNIYHAIDDGPPYLALKHLGYWGSPWAAETVAKHQYAGYWKTGLYGKTDPTRWTTVPDRLVYTKGLRRWIARRFGQADYDIPGMNVESVLANFRATAGTV